ncbi:MAG: arylsulfatase [Candidatus Sumerlaeia bacterium]|nr:arylsulfatase [Candidatus Sumerlaeia bacterium]
MQTRREFMHNMTAAALGAAAFAHSTAANAAGTAQKPNIIFMLADDLGIGDLGCYGQKHIRTPNIDRIAAEGMRFTDCYAGSPVCAPSRCCLMTGMHSGHATVRGNASSLAASKDNPEGRVPLRAEDVTVAEVLKQAGYATALIGKWGLGEPGTPGIPNRQGFDYYFGYLNQNHCDDYYTDYLWRNEEKVIIEENKNGRRGKYSNDLFCDETLDFIRRSKDKPFFIYLAFTIPHEKHAVPSLDPYMDKPWTLRQKTYAAMVTRMDSYVGKVMALLKELNLDEKTIVFFSSDNGAPWDGEEWAMFDSRGGLRGRKSSVWEGGLRTPMVVRWPGRIAAGTVNPLPWAFWDFLPTAGELAGAECPKGIDGVSVAPTLLGDAARQSSRDYLYWEFRTGDGFAQAVRMGNWKGVRFGLEGAVQLYDLSSDIKESRDVAAAHPDIVKKIENCMKTAHVESALWPSSAKPKREKQK